MNSQGVSCLLRVTYCSQSKKYELTRCVVSAKGKLKENLAFWKNTIGFSWSVNGEIKYYVFTVLPFDLSSAPF